MPPSARREQHVLALPHVARRQVAAREQVRERERIGPGDLHASFDAHVPHRHVVEECPVLRDGVVVQGREQHVVVETPALAAGALRRLEVGGFAVPGLDVEREGLGRHRSSWASVRIWVGKPTPLRPRERHRRGVLGGPSVRRRVERHVATSVPRPPCQHRLPQPTRARREDVARTWRARRPRLPPPAPPPAAPAPIPAYPANTRARRTASSIPGSVSAAGTRSCRTPGSPPPIGSTKSATTTAASGCTGPPRNNASPAGTSYRERRDGLGHGRVGGAVQDDADGALLVVMADQQHRPAEVRVPEARTGDQQLSRERLHARSA